MTVSFPFSKDEFTITKVNYKEVTISNSNVKYTYYLSTFLKALQSKKQDCFKISQEDYAEFIKQLSDSVASKMIKDLNTILSDNELLLIY